MRLAIASDHRGYNAKQQLISCLQKLGHEVTDLGPATGDSVDYADYAFLVAEAVSEGRADRGVLICGTGVGMCIAANKVRGVRAAPCYDLVTTEMSRRHNDANILCLSADLLGGDLIERMAKTWLETAFEGGRHARRVDKIKRYEDEHILNSPDTQTQHPGPP
jgi:ribose 5-phosphate isomerase B